MGSGNDVGTFIAPFLLICVLAIMWFWQKRSSSRTGDSGKWYVLKVILASYAFAGLVFCAGIFIELFLFGFNRNSFVFSHIIVIILVSQLAFIPFVVKYMK